MNKIKQMIQQFCTAVTGGVICMIFTTYISNSEESISCSSLGGLLVACFFSILLLQVLWWKESSTKIGYWGRYIFHYIGTLIILIGIGRKFEWLGLQENKNILLFWISVTVIYLGTAVLIVNQSYQMASQINEAIRKHHNNYKEDPN